MAISEDTPQTAWASSGEFSTAIEIATDKGLAIDGGNGQGRVLDTSSGSLSLGTATNINGGNTFNGDVAKLAANTVIFGYEDGSSNDPDLRVLSISGTTITPGTAANCETTTDLTNGTQRITAVSSTLGLFAYQTTTPTMRWCRFTVSGTTVTPGSPQDGSDSGGQPYSLIALDSTRVLLLYGVSSTYKCQVIDISSGISAGSQSTITSSTDPGHTTSGTKQLAKLSADKSVAIYVDSGTDAQIHAVVVNTSGTSISSYGTVKTIATGNCEGPSIWPISASQCVIMYQDSSNNTKLETITISGNTITVDAGGINLSNSDGVYNATPILASGEAVTVGFDNVNGDTWASLITGLPAAATSEIRYLGLSSDTTNLYTTRFKDGVLEFVYYDLATLTSQGTSSFGAVTASDVDDNTYGIYPVARPNSEERVYLRGRDASNVQVQYNNIAGTLGWDDLGPGTATWATTKFAVGLHPGRLNPQDVVDTFDDNDIYRSLAGTTNWVKMGDATINLQVTERFATSPNELMLGGTAAGTIYYTHNFGVTDTDVGGTALGTINWFEVSR